jgi:hypothetical protein
MDDLASADARQAVEPDDSRLRDIAAAVNCFTEDEVCLLYRITPGTAEAWRKRRKGPEHILAGTRPLYPRAAVMRDLAARSREGATAQAKAAL